ncbi:uncharacterized protein M421DRAFT_289464 [Didymella exigua CBS 183.55]|uniref:Uncharacterized protein n=1 Tax=Didymella exigua CBS 183.55 TaxID=1150837 RepID=A0A6A5RXT2_9PLEO|nr:uncharacterized protein M421DRAFT_289464 [Didymella exigua CBS 183.55]KAF1932329.1 hypothetical protein M421DRAFT_289464 [Didymella exigua CBS 183.55]
MGGSQSSSVRHLRSDKSSGAGGYSHFCAVVELHCNLRTNITSLELLDHAATHFTPGHYLLVRNIVLRPTHQQTQVVNTLCDTKHTHPPLRAARFNTLLMADLSTLALMTTSRAYTLKPRPKNLSTTATLIHRLRHPLRMQCVRQPSLLPSNSGSVRAESVQRHPRVADEWLEGLPYELIEVEDQGEYTEQRYGNVDVYWNSVMVEASPDEQERRRVAKEGKRREKRHGRVFDNTEQLYQAYNNRPRNNEARQFRAVPEPARSLDNAPSIPARPDGCSHPVSQSQHDADEDRFITLTERTSVANLNAYQADSSRLTWNSALTQILASPGVDPSISSAIRARARSTSGTKHGGTDEVDMREVSMVPNFSYPVANVRWYDACQASDWPYSGGEECDNNVEDAKSQGRLLNGCGTSRTGTNDDVSFLDLTQLINIDEDSLYRAPTTTPAENRMSDPGSMLRDILDPEELEMYREIMSHNPRFTASLDRTEKRAENRQVLLVAKLCSVIEDLIERLAELEGCEQSRKIKQEVDGYENLYISDAGKLVRAFDLMDLVLEGFWGRECTLLNTLLGVKERKDRWRNVLLRLLTQRTGTHDGGRPYSRENGTDCPLLGSTASSSESGGRMSSNGSLGKKELDALLLIATQNVTILREDLQAVFELLEEGEDKT